MTDPRRRGLVLGLSAAGAGLLLGGCASTATPKGDYKRYTETISSVLASQDHRHVVAVGRNHHYVFDVPELLARALQSPLHTQFKATFTPFHVDAKGDISGEVTLGLPADAAADVQRTAADVGMVRQDDGSWRASVPLKGHRYTSWSYRAPDQTREKLGQAYTIEVTTDQKLDDAVVDAAVTPVRVAADGVQLMYYVVLAPIIIPFVFLTRARDH